MKRLKFKAYFRVLFFLFESQNTNYQFFNKSKFFFKIVTGFNIITISNISFTYSSFYSYLKQKYQHF